jgi:hypothetical protein
VRARSFGMAIRIAGIETDVSWRRAKIRHKPPPCTDWPVLHARRAAVWSTGNTFAHDLMRRCYASTWPADVE